ncbi:RICIN domain-containing protein [Glycomyces niveus]|uniref:RICIN domain-containing protein n=1 Tax=Glycomyces niveus TaxID=2820287 RepID=A0ABS3TZ59_9ACTN|nr:RICIN domain-containing protein [Glycomyces sp. NEAU-S30]MBO3731805.1 RICIN domain-containing protein [Glycomyces sp. NEAU-S30]
MRLRALTVRGRGAAAVLLAFLMVLSAQLLAPQAAQAQSGLTVNLASDAGPSTGVGLGFLYGVNADGSQPPASLLDPLRMNAFRGGGHVSRGWIQDGYRNGQATQAVLASITSQARRFTAAPYNAQYQAILSDMYGAYGGQPANTMYPCDNGNCSNWVTFLETVVAQLRDTGLPITYDIWNEPDIDIFWTRGVNSPQYFQMWDTAVRTIQRVDPDAEIVGPSFAYTPDRRPEQWRTFLSHVKAAGTLPDMIANHTLGNVDDPVAVGDATLAALSAQGIPALPLSANEYQPQNMQTANVTAWYLARFAQSDYDNAIRGNWFCCLTPNLTGLLTQSGGTWQPTGNWWVMKSYADMTGRLVQTSGQVNGTAISAAKDEAARRAVAVLGNINGATGSTSVTFNGLASVPWLTEGGNVHVTVNRIPEAAPLAAPQVVYSQDVSAANGSITVPVNIQNARDAYSVYLTPATGGGGEDTGQLRSAASNRCLDVPNSATTNGTRLQIWDCHTGANQQWTLSASGELSVYSGASRRCLDAYENQTTAGTPVIIWSCHGGTNQRWTLQSDGTVRNALSGLCLDVSGAATANGTQAVLWTCHGGSNQRWSLG